MTCSPNRAVNIYPSQIDDALSSIDGIGSDYQILLTVEKTGRETMRIRVERTMHTRNEDDPHLAGLIASQIRHKVLVRCEVEIVDYGSLPRTERKSQHVSDHRKNHASGKRR